MNIQLPIYAYDCKFNRYTTEDKAKYFKDVHQLYELISKQKPEKLEENSIEMLKISKKRYTWEKITDEYANVIDKSFL